MKQFNDGGVGQANKSFLVKWSSVRSCQSAREVREAIGLSKEEAAQAIVLFSVKHRDQSRTSKLLEEYEVAAQDVFMAAAEMDSAAGVDYYVNGLLKYFPLLVGLARHEQHLGSTASFATYASAAHSVPVDGISDSSIPEGEVVGERYVVRRVIGIGGHSTVYEANDIELGRGVALKISAGKSALETFAREVAALSVQSHCSIVQMLGHGKDGRGRPYVVLDLCQKTLASELPSRPLGAPVALAVTLAIVDAIHAVHSSGFIHGDVKPHNVLLREGSPGLVLTDFSISMTLAEAACSYVRCGTIGYVSPEAFQGRPRDRRADVFSIGMLLYRLLVGRDAVPHAILRCRGEAYLAFLHESVDREAGLALAGVSDEVVRVVQRATAFDAKDRFGTVGEFAAALEAVGAVAGGDARGALLNACGSASGSHDWALGGLELAERSLFLGEWKAAVCTLVDIHRGIATVSDRQLHDAVRDLAGKVWGQACRRSKDGSLLWDIAHLMDSLGDRGKAVAAAKLVERHGLKKSGVRSREYRKFLQDAT
jgi:hypothetical protein